LIVLLQPTPFYSGVRQLTAHAAVGGMRLLGVKAEVIGTLVHSQWGIADIGPECTPDYTIAAFVSALLAFPSSQTYRLFGWLIGVPAIMFINVVRIMSLFYLLGVAPEYVDMAHLVIWPILMVLMTVMLWVMWVMCDPRLRNKA
jgi:exosortase/archaeosortase family protein